LLSGGPPFTGDEDTLFQKIKNEEISYNSSAWANISLDAIDFCKKALNKFKSQRLTADQLLNHPWL